MKYILAFTLLFTSLLSQEIRTLKSDFIQTITSPEGSTLTYSGKIHFKDKNLALWQYEKPTEKSIYFTENKVLVVEPELEQVIVTKISQIPNIQDILRKATINQNGRYFSNYKDTNFSIAFKNALPQIVSYKDKLDNKVDIVFINPLINIEINDKLFSCNIPSHFDIIDQ